MGRITTTALQAVPLFAKLSAKDLKSLAGRFREIRHPAGTVVVREGASGAAFFVIAEGSAVVRIDGEDRATLGPGDHFGEMALIDQGPRSAEVAAVTDVVLYGLSSWEFRPFVQEHPDVAWALLQWLVARVRELNRR